MRTHLYSLVTLKYGMDIMLKKNVSLDKLMGHGGFLRQKAASWTRHWHIAADVPHGCRYETAGEGGAWGIAL